MLTDMFEARRRILTCAREQFVIADFLKVGCKCGQYEIGEIHKEIPLSFLNKVEKNVQSGTVIVQNLLYPATDAEILLKQGGTAGGLITCSALWDIMAEGIEGVAYVIDPIGQYLVLEHQVFNGKIHLTDHTDQGAKKWFTGRTFTFPEQS